MIPVLLDRDVDAQISLLDNAWGDRPTFAFVAEKSGVDLAWVRQALETLPSAYASDHFILLTSGSTGQPKLVIGSKKRAESLVSVLQERQGMASIAEALVVLPLTYCYAFVNQWLWARTFGKTLTLTPGFARPDDLKKTLQGTTNAQLCLVRAHAPLLHSYFEAETFPGIHRLHFAGSRFPQDELPFLKRLFPSAQIFNNYGCTEAMPRLCLRPADEAEVAADVGLPLPGVELQTASSGELQFRSPYGAVAFIDASGFHAIGAADWVGTGDLGQVNGRGHVEIQGRASEVFKRHGEKVSLSVLHDTVARVWTGAAGFYREPDKQGEEGHVLVLAPTPTEEQVRTVLQAFRQHHPRSHWPLRVESVETLPLLPNSKVDTAQLARLDGKKVHWYYRA